LKKAIFLDRDGVINKAIVKNGLPYSPESLLEVEFCDYAISAIAELKNAGFEIIVITNQPDISRGKITFESVKRIHKYIEEVTQINAFYICPDEIELAQSFLVGDRWRDIAAGQEVGCTCYFINYDYKEKRPREPFFEVRSLKEASIQIIGGPK
jgi:D-glycero-D-manno-heptose 1,7-bisphosphate phosphatase